MTETGSGNADEVKDFVCNFWSEATLYEVHLTFSIQVQDDIDT
jgi:hypothetical protein